MAIVVTQPVPGSGVGSGIQVFFSGFTPPNPGDWIAAYTTDGINILSSGATFLFATTGTCLLGWCEVPAQGVGFQGAQGGQTPGHAVSIGVDHFDSSNIVIESALIAGWVHDPFTGYPGLLAKISLSGGWGPSQQSELDSILNAVVTTFS